MPIQAIFMHVKMLSKKKKNQKLGFVFKSLEIYLLFQAFALKGSFKIIFTHVTATINAD